MKDEVGKAYTNKQAVIERKMIYALQVSARSGPGHPSDFAGRPLMCVWAASYRQSLPPNGHCSLLVACRPPPPAGKAALLIPYLKHREQTKSRARCLNITSLKGSTGGHSVPSLHHYWYNINSYCISTGKSNVFFPYGRWSHFSPLYLSVLLKGTPVCWSEGKGAMLCSLFMSKLKGFPYKDQ